MTDLATIAAAAAAVGLAVRGGFAPCADDALPSLAGGRAVATVILLGNVGGSMWPAFAASPEGRTGSDRLDRWTRRVVAELAARLGAQPLYPFGGPPYWPFQRWAQRAEAVHPSPLGLLIHPDHGLWHAYRAALLFAEAIDLPPRDERPSPCTTCTSRPCLTACPVGAFTGAGYDVAGCAQHIASASGADCMDLGCRARRACPIGTGHAYGAEQARFHMEAFLRARSASVGTGRE